VVCNESYDPAAVELLTYRSFICVVMCENLGSLSVTVRDCVELFAVPYITLCPEESEPSVIFIELLISSY